MKIHISEHLDRTIQGFTMIPIVYGEVDLNNIPDNSASTIVAIDAIDSIKLENIPQFLSNVLNKMRFNAELYIGGLDCYTISRALVSGSLNITDYNTLIRDKRGIFSCKYILDILQSYGLNINSVVYKQFNYEIVAIRSNDKN